MVDRSPFCILYCTQECRCSSHTAIFAEKFAELFVLRASCYCGVVSCVWGRVELSRTSGWIGPLSLYLWSWGGQTPPTLPQMHLWITRPSGVWMLGACTMLGRYGHVGQCGVRRSSVLKLCIMWVTLWGKMPCKTEQPLTKSMCTVLLSPVLLCHQATSSSQGCL
jgi:hypothetical protein